MDQLIAQTRVQFEQILSYVQGEAQNQQLHEVEKGIFSALLNIGLTLLSLFFQLRGVGRKGQIYVDNEGVKRPYHSIKQRTYRSIFGKISIARACYWAKRHSEIYPLDAELNLPKTEHSYVLQEWGSILGAEEPYAKAAQFLETVLGTSLWGSSIETIIHESCVNVPKFYTERQEPDAKTEEEILVATIDGKGVVMRKNQIEKPVLQKRRRKMRKIGERQKKSEGVKNNEKIGRKKMSTVIGVYTVASNKRNPETFLSKGSREEERPHPQNKVIQATLGGKEAAARRLQKEVEKRDPQKKKPSVALVDGEHKLRELIKTYLPWLVIIIDIYHVMEYLWKGAHIFHKENTPEAQDWMTDKLTRLLHGKIAVVIEDLKEVKKSLSKGKQNLLQKIITYLENGKEHMRYDIYISKGYPIGSGVVEGACKNLVKDRMEQCGMRWTVAGAEAILGMRSIQINKMTGDYWRYHIAQERRRLYREFSEDNVQELVA